ncbi:PD-(D/E)XK nuclease superfamily protein [Methanobrevibacter cuticularis]|uniref:PD-(D/E)XK nuclease superfamily protein n=1 Tax=Methanobrevibacter cuticularis TaxID=47311 RepID=A0A166FC25_9EURY|nr:PD-(D/E)XK nuclease family protein [Methanobrevibacter cuticularis]KZX17519.1 PD-(D/E)XK nuclease superfamily protein [Methanobrevibacter cuticularis]
MKLSSRSKAYIIPEYSLTGDLISFLTCNLQYRYQNKGTLPPSTPIQLWFGEFIHGVMEEAYLKWKNEKPSFPWDWESNIRCIEKIIDYRLRARGLYAPTNLYCTKYKKYEKSIPPGNDHPYQKIASGRTERAINILGPDLFPLIDSAEVLIKGTRKMPNYKEGQSRSNYYGINGVIDVISSLKISENKNNGIIEYLNNNEEFHEIVHSIDSDEYEIIIDYKGMKRPSVDSDNWNYHQWQLLTYAWLRSKQEDSKPIAAGIIFYLNELLPSTEDLIAIKEDINQNRTDVEIGKEDEDKLMNWDENNEEDNYVYLSKEFMKNRSIRIIPIEEKPILNALEEFDEVVSKIENSMIKEINGTPIKKAWKGKAEKRTCMACDFKTFCNKMDSKDITIP